MARYGATILTAIAIIALPVGIGAVIGLGLRRLRRRRFGGLVAGLTLLVVPIFALGTLVFRYPLVGLWDALLEGAFVGLGLLWTAHRALAQPIQIALAVSSSIVSLLLLELACRAFLPHPPAFPSAGGAHFFLADAMRATARMHSWDLRSKEIVCAVVYESQYAGMIDVSDEQDIITPQRFSLGADGRRRVLHIGDSMTFGFGVSRDETFPAALERLEPGTHQINGAIPGIAPDAYLLVLRRWLARHTIDLAVMYVYEGNDLAGLDDLYPCCGWQSLLTYSSEGVQMRCPTPAQLDFANAGSTWLRYNSPPPYLVRVFADSSVAAAHVAASIVGWAPRQPMLVYQREDVQFAHFAAILRAARDDLAARRIPFVVVVLPSRDWVQDQSAPHLAPAIIEVARRLNVPALDPSSTLANAAARGARLFNDPPDPHFSAEGNEVIARWLHEHLASAGPVATSDPLKKSPPQSGDNATSFSVGSVRRACDKRDCGRFAIASQLIADPAVQRRSRHGAALYRRRAAMRHAGGVIV